MTVGDRIAERRVAAGLSQSELARRVGISQATIGKLEAGLSAGSSYLHRIARELGTTPAYLAGEVEDPSAGAVPAPSAQILKDQLDLAAVREIDLTFGMGSTYLDVPITETMRHFSRDWLRQYTRGDPDTLFFAQGIGDSMAPTILDSDLLLIDASQQSVTMHDRIWVVAYNQSGAVRRLRPQKDGTVALMSDNKALDLPTDYAADGEMSVIGRVVAIVRKT